MFRELLEKGECMKLTQILLITAIGFATSFFGSLVGGGDPILNLFITAIGFATSFIGSLFGAGSPILNGFLVTVLGLPSQQAFATRRVSSIGTQLAEFYVFRKEGKIRWKITAVLVPIAAIGASSGAFLVTLIPNAALKYVIGATALLTAIYLLLNPNIGVENVEQKGRRGRFVGYTLIWFLGVVKETVGGMMGAIEKVVLVKCFGLTLNEAKGTKKPSELIAAATSLAVFIFFGLPVWPVGLALIAGSAPGAFCGSTLQLKKLGDKGVRWFVILILIGLSVQLFFFQEIDF